MSLWLLLDHALPFQQMTRLFTQAKLLRMADKVFLTDQVFYIRLCTSMYVIVSILVLFGSLSRDEVPFLHILFCRQVASHSAVPTLLHHKSYFILFFYNFLLFLCTSLANNGVDLRFSANNVSPIGQCTRWLIRTRPTQGGTIG